MTLEEQLQQLRAHTKVIAEVVHECSPSYGGYCPEGPIYAAMQDTIHASHFRQLVDAMIGAELLERGPIAHTLVCNVARCRELGIITVENGV